jgi:hypothetical protein
VTFPNGEVFGHFSKDLAMKNKFSRVLAVKRKYA